MPDTDDVAMVQDDDFELVNSTDTFLANYSVNQTVNDLQNISKANTTTIDEDNTGEKLTLGIDENALQSTQFTDTTGFDFNSGSVWIYPVNENQPMRSYQFSIVEQCLHKNTMVVLPTGMGKTFIAAVVMYNFYRWYPLGKTIFMAPTKPLVNQQSDACYQIVGIPKNDMTSMTGQMAPEKRKLLWNTKRVFFLTPQVISNDILRGTVDSDLIKCVVIDEAHKALGDYAFCKVIESISESNKNFRIIALTATPGSDIKAVQNVINKLLISHIELRSDDSIDIQQYSNNRTVDKYVLSLSDEILKIRNAYYKTFFVLQKVNK
ncbi:Fanconi anemia group M [Brachionus plicatilis]|uniref:Fanconi anemia group M n=1 Tax=Brachionus plicatilis TaxID=10195 RepID=A0A3M7T3F7_BRAPC|nr:Fanconi anemia group M [Brachionus plicatilis]